RPGARTPWSPCRAPYRGCPPRPSRGAPVSWEALRADALACHAAALAAVEPGGLVARRLERAATALRLRGRSGELLAEHAGRVLVVGAGKAALAMARAAAEVVGDASAGGLVVVPHGGAGPCPGGIEVATGAHPVPDGAGEAATARLLAAVGAADAATLVLVVLSGGASSLLVAPAAGLTLADKQALGARLLASGADIGALNVVRKHCSRVKGGGLAGYAAEVAAEPLGGDAAEAGRVLAARLGAARGGPFALVAGGETTVRVRPGGRGGRAQQLALAAAVALEGAPCVLLAAGTDGVDGPTDAAGACVDGGTVARAWARGLDPAAALAATDSHQLLAATRVLHR